MKIFLSWSGERSKYIAESLRDWLPNVIQCLEPFISSQDIAKGTRGNVVITKNLEEANVGIICLTPENLGAPWILFEAGALSKLSSAYVCTYLYDLKPTDVEQPLGQFQHTDALSQTEQLLEAIDRESVKPLGGRLHTAYETWWPKLKEKLDSVPPKPESEPAPIIRSEESKYDEILDKLRQLENLLMGGIEQRAVGTSYSSHIGPILAAKLMEGEDGSENIKIDSEMTKREIIDRINRRLQDKRWFEEWIKMIAMKYVNEQT